MNDAAQVQAHVEQFAQNVGRGALIGPSMDLPDCQANQVSVTVRGNAVSLLPFLTLTVSEKASGQVEKFNPS